MWVVRELTRLLVQIVVATAIAAGVAGLWALAANGNLVSDLRLSFLLFGCLLLLLAGAGNRATASGRRMTYGVIGGFRSTFGRLAPPVNPKPGEPTLTASAVFVGSALALIALGVAV